ncbi:MAG: sulfate reduction electron transfer complex DsrMKJOP subunit DsrO [Planctomycetota bacterium]
MNRRNFLTAAGGTILLGGAGAYGMVLIATPAPGGLMSPRPPSTRRWGMVIDLNKCRPDCTKCLQACRTENNVAFHGDKRWDIHWIRKVTVRSKHSQSSLQRTVLLMCNHCDHPPCAQVCPVQATYKRDDGIVLVDHHRCIGCRYCVMSCPYNARYFNFRENPDWPNRDYPKRSHGVAESCNFCAHLIDRGELPACVTTCQRIGVGAIAVGDLNDPQSEVSRLIDESAPKRIREDLGTEPKVYYVGL